MRVKRRRKAQKKHRFFRPGCRVLALGYHPRNWSLYAAEIGDAVYLFEFKLRGTAQEALAQIDERGYMIPSEATDKTLYKIGACFDEKLKPLKEWVIVEGE